MAVEQTEKEPRAIPALAEWYAVQHIQEQESIADKVAAGLALLWPIIRFDDLDGSTRSWLHATTLEIEKGFESSSQAAFEFVQSVKWAVEPESEPLVKAVVKFPSVETQLGMRVTGPVAVKRSLPAIESEAMAAGEHGSTGVGVKQAMNGGRAQVLTQVAEEFVRADAEVAAHEAGEFVVSPVKDREWARLQELRAELDALGDGGSQARAGRVRQLIADVEGSLGGYVPASVADAVSSLDVNRAAKASGKKRAVPVGALNRRNSVGYARVTDNDPCYFCAILASQGAVYYGETSFAQSNSKIREVKWASGKDKGSRRAFIGDGPAKVHDHCRCHLRPVYSLSDKWDARAKYFLKQWEDLTEGKSGKDAINAFRAGYVPPPPYSNVLDLEERRQILVDARFNRELLIARGFAAGSPQVKFFDRSISKLEAA